MHESIPLWECYEHTFRVQERFDNPYVDVRLTVTLHQDERRYTVDGFYDGEEGTESIFRFRFAAMHRGRWGFTTASNVAKLNNISGEFETTDPVSRGGLTVSSQFPNWFFRQDGEPQLILNDGWTPHPGSTYGIERFGPQRFTYPSEEQYRVFLENISRYGVNMIVDLRQLYARQDSNSDPSYLWPWEVVDPESCRIDRDRFNLAFFQRLDRQLIAARRHEVFYGVELLYDNSTYRRAEWAHHPWNERNGGWIEDWDGAPDDYTRNQLPFGWGVRRIFDLENRLHVGYLKRYLSYALARISAYRNVFYAVGCESSNIYPGVADRVNKWYTYWGDFIASKDPHGRLCTVGDVGAHDSGEWHVITGDTERVYENARNNIVVTQEHSLSDDVVEFSEAINRFGERYWEFRRPVIIGEQDGRNNLKYDKERRAYWTAFVSGFMMGRVDRHYAMADGPDLRERKLFGLDDDPAIYRSISHLKHFVEETRLPFWRLKPSDSLLQNRSRGVFCLAEEDETYLLYFADGGTAGLQLSDGPFTTRWFDPRDGSFRERETSAGGTSITFEAPDHRDWVFLAQRGAGGE